MTSPTEDDRERARKKIITILDCYLPNQLSDTFGRIADDVLTDTFAAIRAPQAERDAALARAEKAEAALLEAFSSRLIQPYKDEIEIEDIALVSTASLASDIVKRIRAEERERCAKIAEDARFQGKVFGVTLIAAAIRGDTDADRT